MIIRSLPDFSVPRVASRSEGGRTVESAQCPGLDILDRLQPTGSGSPNTGRLLSTNPSVSEFIGDFASSDADWAPTCRVCAIVRTGWYDRSAHPQEVLPGDGRRQKLRKEIVVIELQFLE